MAAIPGTSRDRNIGIANIAGLPLRVIDTGGYDERGSIQVHIKHQVTSAVREADVVVFMLDGKEGVTASDERLAAWLRKELGKVEVSFPSAFKREIIIVANKTEGAHLSDRVLDALAESSRLGFGEPIFMSASHGEGMVDMCQKFRHCAEERGLDLGDDEGVGASRVAPLLALAHQDKPIQVAIMGRPNVGKVI